MEENKEAKNIELEELAENLSGESRRSRQVAATELAAFAKDNPELLLPYGKAIVDALNRPEAQTRWECLEILTALVDYDAAMCEEAILGAETALFDEDSGLVRLGAMRFLCKIGASSPDRSDKVWTLVDEGIQCYHGDTEFQDMLAAVIDFSTGDLSDEVKKGLAARMRFDAENAKGSLARRAQLIIDNTERG